MISRQQTIESKSKNNKNRVIKLELNEAKDCIFITVETDRNMLNRKWIMLQANEIDEVIEFLEGVKNG